MFWHEIFLKSLDIEAEVRCFEVLAQLTLQVHHTSGLHHPNTTKFNDFKRNIGDRPTIGHSQAPVCALE